MDQRASLYIPDKTRIVTTSERKGTVSIIDLLNLNSFTLNQSNEKSALLTIIPNPAGTSINQYSLNISDRDKRNLVRTGNSTFIA
jgi:hypothetical protein